MTIADIIGEGKPFEPPFRRRGNNINDKNLRTLAQIKAHGTLRAFGTGDTKTDAHLIADHLCDLLNREHCKEGGEG